MKFHPAAGRMMISALPVLWYSFILLAETEDRQSACQRAHIRIRRDTDCVEKWGEKSQEDILS